MGTAEQIHAKMRASIESYDAEAAAAAAKEAVASQVDLLAAVEKGFAEPIRELGEAIQASGGKLSTKGVVVIGTVEGDIHDIGKTVVAALLSANGYDVHDLGVEVPAGRFIEAAAARKADVIGLSALLSTTMLYQRDVLELLRSKGLKDRYFVAVGGAPVTQAWASEIGADGYARGAYEAVQMLEASRKRWAK